MAVNAQVVRLILLWSLEARSAHTNAPSYAVISEHNNSA